MHQIIRPICLLLLLTLALNWKTSAQEAMVPSFEEILSLHRPGTPMISPDGRNIAYTVTRTDWSKNGYNTEIWLAKGEATPFQLTNSPDGSSSDPQWSPDGKWIAFLRKHGDHSQIHVIRPDGGEARAMTNADRDIQDFEWSPDGKRFAIRMQQPESKTDKERKERFGAYEVDDAEYRRSWLYIVDFQPDMPLNTDLPCYDEKDESAQSWDCLEWPEIDALIDSVDYTISGYKWSPQGDKIVFNHQPDPLINSFFDSDISILDVASKEVSSLVKNPSADFFADWSPDGKAVLYESSLDNRTSNYYKNGNLFKIPVGGGKPVRLAADFDEEFNGYTWTESGILATAWQKTYRPIYRIDPATGKVQKLGNTPRQIYGFTATKKGDQIAFSGEADDHLNEIYRTGTTAFRPQAITDFTSQIADWKIAQSEVISWKSKDGATIEGVLHKPQDYDPSKKYPLLVVIHGGPTGIDRPSPVPSSIYPILHWLDKGALVLRPNYRGSAGYGEAFRSLNVRNLGVGDAWDVLSGVDHLVNQGLIDTSRMGAMGWSQGGYISAFLTTNTHRFKAISVGAGISNWMTYYVNTDIHPFTRQYLEATPWQDEEIYKKTSPMTNINNATTPTLIQHGEFDRRVPIANAYELLQGLRDVGVEAKLIVYKGFGHGISKPKERLAAAWHNWQWFNKYLWGEEVKLPIEAKE
ncbi:MAG: S9 family peptidase [Saprospiraceae bacterium]|nr:S9 family peptidase [Lewinella sp.]